MALDPRIILGAQQPQDPLQQYAGALGVANQVNQNKLAQLQFQQAEREQARQNKLQELLSAQYATPEAREGALLQGGFVDQSLKLGKDRRDNAKLDQETNAKRIEALGKVNGMLGSTAAALLNNPNLSYQDVAVAADRLKSMVPQEFHGALDISKIPQDPAGLRQSLQQFYQQSIDTEKMLADATSRRNNDETNRTSRENNAASNATSRANNAATVGATIRGQNMTDARQREANLTNRDLLMQEKQLKIGELQDKANDRQRGKEAQIGSIGSQIAVIDKALAHPGRGTATGLSGKIDPRNYIPGTDATNFQTVLDQIGGSAFLQAFESLKGGGQITEIEGKKATDAIARLSRAQSDAEFERSLNDLRSVMTTAYQRASGKDYISPLQPAQPTTAFPNQPDLSRSVAEEIERRRRAKGGQ